MASKALMLLIALVWGRLLIVLALGLRDIRRWQAAVTSLPSLEDITILIPAYDEAQHLDETLRSTLPVVKRGARLVVVDDGSVDGTGAIARTFVEAHHAGLVLTHASNLGKAAALNTGLAAVTTPFVLTLDADTRLELGSLDAARAEIARRDAIGTRVCAVAFDITLPRSPNLLVELQGVEYDASLNFERRAQGVLGAISVCPGAASLWRMTSLREIGGFSDATVTEDVDATLRLAARGERAAHHPGARATTSAPRSWAKLMAQRRRWCLGHYESIPRNWPRLGTARRYRLLTFPNFLGLSMFLPAMLLASLAVVLTEPAAVLRQSLWGVNAVWLVTVYTQRAIALKSARRSTTMLAFLLEPMVTAFVHLSAVFGILRFARRSPQRTARLWQVRAR